MSDPNSLRDGTKVSSTSTALTPKPRSPSLAACAAQLELIFQEIDNFDGEITTEMVARFDDASLAVSAKTDNWIWYLDTLKFMIAGLKERKDRATKAQKSAEALNARLREFLRGILQSNPGVPFKGNDGSLALQKNPESVSYAFDTESKTFYSIVPPATLTMFPDLRPYASGVTVILIDGARVKADLKAGKALDFAKLETGSHVRIRS